MKAGTNTRLAIASGQMRNCKVYHCPCVSVSFPKKRYQNMTLVYSFSEETSPLPSALLKFVVSTALAPPPPYPRPQPCKCEYGRFHGPRAHSQQSHFPDPSWSRQTRRGLASLVMVACWTIHNLIGSIYLLFTPSPATTTSNYPVPRNTQHNVSSRRNSAFTDAQTRLAHSAHRWQQNRHKFLSDRLQIDARVEAYEALRFPKWKLSSVCTQMIWLRFFVIRTPLRH